MQVTFFDIFGELFLNFLLSSLESGQTLTRRTDLISPYGCTSIGTAVLVPGQSCAGQGCQQTNCFLLIDWEKTDAQIHIGYILSCIINQQQPLSSWSTVRIRDEIKQDDGQLDLIATQSADQPNCLFGVVYVT